MIASAQLAKWEALARRMSCAGIDCPECGAEIDEDVEDELVEQLHAAWLDSVREEAR